MIHGGGGPKIITGSYTGDGTATRTISLGVHPEMVLVLCAEYSIGDPYSDAYGGISWLHTGNLILITFTSA